jgi:hypothetical protein
MKQEQAINQKFSLEQSPQPVFTHVTIEDDRITVEEGIVVTLKVDEKDHISDLDECQFATINVTPDNAENLYNKLQVVLRVIQREGGEM